MDCKDILPVFVIPAKLLSKYHPGHTEQIEAKELSSTWQIFPNWLYLLLERKKDARTEESCLSTLIPFYGLVEVYFLYF
jgi:hypothetical protein